LRADIACVSSQLSVASPAREALGKLVKRESLFDAVALHGGHGADSRAASSGSEMALRSQIASAAVCESARAYRAPRARKRASLAIARGTRGPSAAICDPHGKNCDLAEVLVQVERR
jgi:hypothetical protein